ncbi:MAG: hypothetical protein E6J47_04945 [Chloroflexi bacterium]|nr:MAG: hypothetical protein E6J47_04945 [Chloroflexota bacterium]
MTTPRTISGQAILSGMRPHLKRAFGPTVLAIEAEAIAPYVEALRQADLVLAEVAEIPAGEAPPDLAQRAQAAHRAASTLLASKATDPE